MQGKWLLLLFSCAVILLETVVFTTIYSDITAMATEGTLTLTILGNDTTVPAVSIVLPANGSIFNQNDSVSFRVQATDASGISSVLANVTLPNGSLTTLTLADGDSDSNFDGTFTETAQNGTYLFTAFVKDSTGLNNNSESVQFIVNVTAPAEVPAPSGQGGGSAGAGVGVRSPDTRAPVTPTVEVPPPPVQYKITPTVEQPTQVSPLQQIAKLPQKALIMLKELPSLVVEKGKAVSAIVAFSVLNAVVAIGLIAFAVYRMLQIASQG